MRASTVPPELRRQPFSTGTGLSLVGEGTLRGPSYRRVAHGAYMTSDMTLSHGRVIQAMRAIVGDSPVLVGPSAAWALGLRAIDPPATVHMTGGQPRRRDGLVMHRLDVRGSAIMTDLGLATDPLHTAIDVARGVGTAHLGRDSRIALVDGFVRAVRLPVDQVRRELDAVARLRGLPMARQVLSLARDGVDSVKETELRLLLLRLGFPEPTVQCPAFSSDGRIIARLDLGWADLHVGCEYDGAVHREPDQHTYDLFRHNRLRAAAWHVVQVDARALRRPDRFVPQLTSLLGVTLPQPAESRGNR